MATTKKTSASGTKKRSSTSRTTSRKPAASTQRALQREPSLWTMFWKSKVGKLLVLVLLVALVVVICLALFGEDPATFFRVIGVCILLFWGGLVIYSLVRRRNS